MPDLVDACLTDGPNEGEHDRDGDGCIEFGSSFRFVKHWPADRFPVTYETDAVGYPGISDGSDFADLAAGFANWTSIGAAISGGDDLTRGASTDAASGDGRNTVSFQDPDGYLPGILAITPTAVAVVDTFLNGELYRKGEIIDADVNKAAAIRRVLSERGLSIDETLVFGDSGNDVEMVTEIPVSVAMEGCHPQTCGAALLRGGDNDTDTIAQIIRSLAMGPGCR